MQFYEVLAQVIELLQRQGRMSYWALKRQFDLDNDYLEDLKAEMIKAKRLAVDKDGDGLVWTGGAALTAAAGPSTGPERVPQSYTPAHLTETSDTLFGKKYEVVLPITGLNGRIVDVMTIWQFDRLLDGTGYANAPRLVTLYGP